MAWCGFNTDSGLYHKSESRFYGKTTQGKFMKETDAQAAGYLPDRRLQMYDYDNIMANRTKREAPDNQP